MPENHPYLDFKAIKARINIADLLARYQVNLVRVNQSTLKGTCPLPTHSSGSKNTFYANAEKSVWYCHSDSCKKNGRRAGGNIIDFVAQLEQCSVYAAAKRLEELFPATSADSHTAPAISAGARSETPQTTVANSLPTSNNNKPLAFALKDINPSHPMIQERGISIETATQFGVGYFPGKGSMAGRIVFPCYENGALVGYAGRATAPNQEPKWLLGKGLCKSFVYGLEKATAAKPLILVESFWGVLFLFQQGAQAASLMGTEMTEAQERCLEPFKVITVAMDNDAVGNERAALIIQRLRAAGHVVMKARLME